MEDYKEGIYFGMSDEEYHGIPYFSRSACEDMIFDPSGKELRYKREHPKQETPAMQFGSALHCLILENERFHREYARKPSIENMRGKIILKSTEDLKLFLANVGEKVSGKKADLIDRALPYVDPEKFLIWDNVLESFHEQVEQNNMKVLTDDDIDTLDGIYESFSSDPLLPKLIENSKFEVVILWRDESTGVMCKCKLDSIRPEAIVDLKTFSVKGRKSLKRTMQDTVTYDRYNLQFFVYHKAVEDIIKKIKASKASVNGEIDYEWMEKFLESETKLFYFLFMRTQAPYQCDALKLSQSYSEGATPNEYYSSGQFTWETGLTLYKDIFIDQVERDRTIDDLHDEDIPNIVYQNTGL